jgi:hypothetical protein
VVCQPSPWHTSNLLDSLDPGLLRRVDAVDNTAAAEEILTRLVDDSDPDEDGDESVAGDMHVDDADPPPSVPAPLSGVDSGTQAFTAPTLMPVAFDSDPEDEPVDAHNPDLVIIQEYLTGHALDVYIHRLFNEFDTVKTKYCEEAGLNPDTLPWAEGKKPNDPRLWDIIASCFCVYLKISVGYVTRNYGDEELQETGVTPIQVAYKITDADCLGKTARYPVSVPRFWNRSCWNDCVVNGNVITFAYMVTCFIDALKMTKLVMRYGNTDGFVPGTVTTHNGKACLTKFILGSPTSDGTPSFNTYIETQRFPPTKRLTTGLRDHVVIFYTNVLDDYPFRIEEGSSEYNTQASFDTDSIPICDLSDKLREAMDEFKASTDTDLIKITRVAHLVYNLLVEYAPCTAIILYEQLTHGYVDKYTLGDLVTDEQKILGLFDLWVLALPWLNDTRGRVACFMGIAGAGKTGLIDLILLGLGNAYKPIKPKANPDFVFGGLYDNRNCVALRAPDRKRSKSVIHPEVVNFMGELNHMLSVSDKYKKNIEIFLEMGIGIYDTGNEIPLEFVKMAKQRRISWIQAMCGASLNATELSSVRRVAFAIPKTKIVDKNLGATPTLDILEVYKDHRNTVASVMIAAACSWFVHRTKVRQTDFPQYNQAIEHHVRSSIGGDSEEPLRTISRTVDGEVQYTNTNGVTTMIATNYVIPHHMFSSIVSISCVCVCVRVNSH